MSENEVDHVAEAMTEIELVMRDIGGKGLDPLPDQRLAIAAIHAQLAVAESVKILAARIPRKLPGLPH